MTRIVAERDRRGDWVSLETIYIANLTQILSASAEREIRAGLQTVRLLLVTRIE